MTAYKETLPKLRPKSRKKLKGLIKSAIKHKQGTVRMKGIYKG